MVTGAPTPASRAPAPHPAPRVRERDGNDAQVVLLRHAATVAPQVCQGVRHDTPLSEEGKRQVEEAATRLGGFDRCVVSPLGRARATAAVAFGGATEVDPRWRERDFGAWEGRDWADVIGEVPSEARRDVVAYLAVTPEGAEPWASVTRRVGEALDELGQAAGTSLVVTHGGPVRAAVAHALDIPLECTLRFRPGHGTSVWLTRTGGEWQLDRFGW